MEFAPGEATFDHYMDLGVLCEDLYGRRVEIVMPNSLSPYLGPHILRDIEYVLIGLERILGLESPSKSPDT